jgi:hypothetical protein
VPALRAALAAEGIEPVDTTPAQFSAFIRKGNTRSDRDPPR